MSGTGVSGNERANDGDDFEDVASDADSDEMELRGDIARFDQSVREFLSSHQSEEGDTNYRDEHPDTNQTVERVKISSKGVARGPRKAAEPRGDIKFRLARVNQSFMSGDYGRARDLVFEIIRINAETHQAWTVLASIFREEGLDDKALMAMVIAAHLRPKDAAGWITCASFAMSLARDGQDSVLKTALMCYSSAVKAQPTNLEARLGRAEASHLQGFLSQAISEFSYVLERNVFDINVVRRLAEACVDSGVAEDVRKAISAYSTYITHARNADGRGHRELSWYDLHLQWLDPTESATANAVEDFPYLIRDIADELFAIGRYEEALDYYELLPETCFLMAIEVDETNIDARIELAKIYEKSKEEEEALILVTEAYALQGAHDEGDHLDAGGIDRVSRASRYTPGIRAAHLSRGNKPRRKREAKSSPINSGVVRPRYRPKRLVPIDQRMQEERARADELTRRYELVRNLKREIQAGHHGLIPSWMTAAGDLVGEFRSFKRFYPWDKYLKFLGAANDVVFSASSRTQPGLSELAERLSKNIGPSLSDEKGLDIPCEDDGYRGIPFGEWLELFLDYAVSLALANRGEEAYQVCEAARDSIVFVNSKDYMFLIHVAWAACAIYLADEEMCVAVARFFMKVRQLDSDSYRMFAALCRLCQSPASWYNSGPAQKYILRQIKTIDASHLSSSRSDTLSEISAAAPSDPKQLDVCLLMLYGHILFTSTSYTFALSR
ncbi:Transcription factor tau subunit sfc4 [Colletotrichum trifolii]|uniref:Transcription factor tau subunit sfc4 n=1 Tax=Colletotrichum trifolii TaxID=5466 RepID=A0A4R8Q312_COLTR|nr:Transcription factor tau subunit sfc4 [Colletotrichum trifolii]